MKILSLKGSIQRAWERYGKKYKFCERCGKEYKVCSPSQRFCGSHRRKEGCAFIHHIDRKRKDGIKRRTENPEHHRQRIREWYRKHPEKISKYSKEFYYNHREQILKKQKKNPKRLAYYKKYRDSGKALLEKKRFYSRNPDYMKKYNKQYREKKRSIIPNRIQQIPSS